MQFIKHLQLFADTGSVPARAERSGVPTDLHIFGEREMMRLVSIAVLWVAFAMPAFADCTRPSAPTVIPDGKTAAMEEMMAAKKVIDAYKRSMEEYLDCEKSGLKLDSAQAELVKVADRFNLQVRAFKAKG
jgi:hypothetical protein